MKNLFITLVLITLVLICSTAYRTDMYVPGLPEIQRMVGAKDDGMYGPETKEKWKRAVNDQFAVEEFRRAK